MGRETKRAHRFRHHNDGQFTRLTTVPSHIRKARRRRRNEIAKASRRANRA